MIQMPRMTPKHSYASLIAENRRLRTLERLKEHWSTAKDEAMRDFVNMRISEINQRIRASNGK